MVQVRLFRHVTLGGAEMKTLDEKRNQSLPHFPDSYATKDVKTCTSACGHGVIVLGGSSPLLAA